MKTQYKRVMIKTLHFSGTQLLGKPIEIEGFIHQLDMEQVLPTIKGRIEENGYLLDFNASIGNSKFPFSIENTYHGLKCSYLENTKVILRGMAEPQESSRFPILVISETETKYKKVRIA